MKRYTRLNFIKIILHTQSVVKRVWPLKAHHIDLNVRNEGANGPLARMFLESLLPPYDAVKGADIGLESSINSLSVVLGRHLLISRNE